MATLISVLSQPDLKRFELPPVLSEEDRVTFFELPQWACHVIETLRTPTNKAGFVLQLGYFRAVNKFFSPKDFHTNDVAYVSRPLGISEKNIYLNTYEKTSYERHQSIILENLGFRKFNNKVKKIVQKEADALSKKLMRPRSLFMSLVDFMRSKRFEVPSYHVLSDIISESQKVGEGCLYTKVDLHVSKAHKCFLDNLLDISDEYLGEEKRDLKVKRYKITLLKKSHQSTKPSRIKENINDLVCLKELFDELEYDIRAVGLPPETIQYYAGIAIKSQVFQLARRDERKYLYLLAFVINQYYRLNDVLADVILQSVQSSLNSSSREHREQIYKTRSNRHLIIKDLAGRVSNNLDLLKELEYIVNAEDISDAEKLAKIRSLLGRKEDHNQIENQLRSLEQEANRILKDDDYYDILEKKSLSLQNRVSPILKVLVFDESESDKNVFTAIKYFKKKDGNLGYDAPLGFLDDDQSKVIFDMKGKLRVSLYKFFLFQQIAEAIKSGVLNVKHSYKYRPFETYLISKERWKKEKHELIDRAGLLGFEDFGKIEPELKRALEDQFRITNENIISGANKYAKFNDRSNLVISTPKKDKAVVDPVAMLFPKERIIPIFEVLSTINKLTYFIVCFEHHQVKNVKKRPSPNLLLAGVTGLGCNHGIRRISKMSRNISQGELEYAVNWHFSVDNLIRANDRVIELINRLQLSKLFKGNKAQTHTSSDGQKFNISVESLNANYSFKYFGKGKGVTVYVFLDQSHRLFYSVVISSAESEAHYVIDGLMHNDIVQSDIHSTDTAGYNEIIFCVCHLLGISFAPRIKNFLDQQLYSYEKRSFLRTLGYKVLPVEGINSKLILENWEDILRFIVTIKLRETTASQLLRRLSSYSRQHRLYKALKEFGKIIKTLFLLKYIDDLDLRQAIEKQLNKQESSNKFGKAVFHGNNNEFQQSTKEDQMIAESCKRLIENSVICWNYLYLSKLILNSQSEEEKQTIIQAVKNGSVVFWHHVNMQGDYDFSDDYLKDAIEFSIDDLIKLQVT